MALTYQSAQTATVAGTTLVITKPASVAVGDYLFAIISTQNTIDTAPSGWTALTNKTSAGGGVNTYVYYVKATSTQVSATDFTWTASSNCMVGGIIRITGDFHGTPLATFASDDEASTTTPTYVATVTPATPNSLILFCLGSGSAGGGTNAASAYAIATSNPSWTEAFDVAVDSGGSGNVHAAVAYATRPEITATGNASATLSGARESVGIIVVIRPQVVSTLTETESVVDTAVKSINKTLIETESAVESLTATKQKDWNNVAKNSSSITNIDKH